MIAPANTSNSDVSPPRPDEEKAMPSQNDQQSSMHDTKTPRSIHGWKWALSYTAMLSTTFLFALDNTIVADIQPAILNDLGQTELLPWIGTGFALGNMVILPWSKAYGIFSIRRLYIFNILVFEIGSALCGAAPNMTAMILGRVIAGVGGSGMYSGTLTYVALCTSMKERATYMAGSTAVWGIGTVLGPVVGGAFAESSASWRWGFYINLVVGAVFAPAYLFLFPSINPQPQLSLPQKLKGWDWPMTVAFLSGSTFLTMAISFGGGLYSWHSAAEIVFWTLSGVFFVTTIVLVKFHPGVSKENQLWPSHFLRMPVVMNMQLQVFLPSEIVLAITYYIPLYFQFIRASETIIAGSTPLTNCQGDGPLDAGVRLLPLIITMVVVSMISGFLLSKTLRFSPWYIGGSALVLVGTALMYTIDENTPNANIYGYNILIGVGAGCYIVIGFTVVQSLVPPRDIANAVAVMTIGKVLGMVLCLSISGTVFQNMAVKEVGKALPQLSGHEVAQLVAAHIASDLRSWEEIWHALSAEISDTGLSRQVKELQARLERAEARLTPDNGTPVERSPNTGSLRMPSLIPPSSGLDFPPYEPVLDTTFADMDCFDPQFLSDISADHFNLLDHSEHPHNFDERQFGQTQDPDTNNGSARLNLRQFGGSPAHPNSVGPSQDKTLKYEGKEQAKPSQEDLAILYRFFFDFIYDSLPMLCEAPCVRLLRHPLFFHLL
ncbi:Major facilitator superfamily domain general substrate transporter, partial [Fusarium albosuccineum]